MLDLGTFAISDFLDSLEYFVDYAPLIWVRCNECTLVQLRDTVDRERLYRRYWYRSGTQESMVRALREVVADCQSRVRLSPGDVVLDIGANDGTLLRAYPDGLIRYAYEPAENLWPLLESPSRDPKRGISLAGAFFPTLVGGKPVGMVGGAKIITSIACFYDVDDPGLFVDGIRENLAEDGVWVNQMAYLPDTLAANNFGDICHEHLTYWTVESFFNLLQGHGLYLNDYSFNDVNGGSIRTIVSRQRYQQIRHDAPSAEDIQHFGKRIVHQSLSLYGVLSDLKFKGQTVVGYGASTKGATYLQYWNLPNDLLKYIADRNPDKVGKFTPTGQEVISEDSMRMMAPDYLLVLPFHFVDSFVDREAALLANGTQFLVPFPTPHVIGGGADADLLTQVA